MAITIIPRIIVRGPVPPPITAVTGQTLGTLRSDFTGSVGFLFLANRNLTVYSVGRWVVSGNSLTHLVRILLNGGGPLSGATVDCNGATAGTYVYAPLSPPLALSSSATYRIESGELSGGDQWYDLNTTLTSTSDITVQAHSVGGAGSGDPGHSYVPPNFLYR